MSVEKKKKEFKIGDLVVVTHMIKDNYDEEYFDCGSWGKITLLDHSKYLVDFSNKGIDEWGDCVFWAEPSQLKHYTPIEDLPLWKANHMYLDEEQQQALRKLLHRVQWDEEYAEKISFSGVDDNDIGTAFTWEYTEEGHVFWEAIDEQCANEEIQQPIIPDDVREEIQSLHHSAECVIVEEQSKPNGGSSALATQEGGSGKSSEYFLQKAIDLQKERGKEYDSGVERSMGKCVSAFNIITGQSLSEAEGWLLLQLLKDVRQWTKPGYHADSAEDGVSYSSLKAEALSRGK